MAETTNVDEILNKYDLYKTSHPEWKWWTDISAFKNAKDNLTNSSKTSTIDIDGYYDFYGVMAPNVEVSFLTKDGWKNINKISGSSKIQNNYFVSAQIEDTGFRKLTLTLFDRNFYSLQSLIFNAIKVAGGSQKVDENNILAKEDADISGTTDKISFVKTNTNSIKNNLRIRYGYEDYDMSVEQSVNTYSGLKNNKFGSQRTGRWYDYGANTLNSKGYALSQELTYGSRNQTTLRSAFEDFFIIDVVSNLTNTGIQYTITAVGTDTYTLNAYKFIQYYAQITAKPREIMAFFMNTFNEGGNNLMRVVWDDEMPLLNGDEVSTVGGISKNEDELSKLKKELSQKEALQEFIRNTIAVATQNNSNSISKAFAGNYVAYDEAMARSDIDAFSPNKRSLFDILATFSGGGTDENGEKKWSRITTVSLAANQRLYQFIHYLSSNWSTISAYGDNKNDWIDQKTYIKVFRVKLLWLYGLMASTYTFSNSAINSKVSKLVIKGSDDIHSKISTNIDKINNIINTCSITPESNDEFDNYVSTSGYTALKSNLKSLVNSILNLEINGKKFQDYTITHGMDKNLDSSLSGKDYLERFVNYYINHLPASDKIEKKTLKKNYIVSKNSNWRSSELANLKNIINAKSFSDYCDGVSNFFMKNIGIDSFAENTYNPSPTIALLSDGIPKAEYFYEGSSPVVEIRNLSETRDLMIDIAKAISYLPTKEADECVRELFKTYPNSLGSYSLAYDPIYSPKENAKTFEGAYLDKGKNIIYWVVDGGYCYYDRDKTDKEGNPAPETITVKDKTEIDKIQTKIPLGVRNPTVKKFYTGKNVTLDNIVPLGEKGEYNYEWLNVSGVELNSLANSLSSVNETISWIERNIGGASTANGIISWVDKNIVQNLDSGSANQNASMVSLPEWNSLALKIWSSVQSACLARNTYSWKLDSETERKLTDFNESIKQLKERVASLASKAAKNKITLILGGEEAGSPYSSDGKTKKLYKSVSSLFNSFVSQCPPLTSTTTVSDGKVNTNESNEKIIVTDENGDQKEQKVETYSGSFPLGWSLMSSPTESDIAVVGFHYKRPKKLNYVRRYCWGTGNPKSHAVKDVSIQTSSEFGMLNMAINVARNGAAQNASSDGTITVRENYPIGKNGAFVNNVVSSQTELQDLQNTMINSAVKRGTITVLGDPSLRFAGIIQPYTYPILLDIKLQNDNSWSSETGTKSQLSGYYVITKITHNLSASGYTTTLEILSYPGIKKEVLK